MGRGHVFLAGLGAMLAVVSAAHAGNCSNPTGVEGTITYNRDYKTMQFCNGTNWVAMGGVWNVPWQASGTTVYYNGGNVGIGTGNPTTKLQISSSGINNHILLTSGAQNWGVFTDGSSFVIGNGAAGSYGTGVWLGNGGQSWSALSDIRLKSDVETYPVLDRLKDYRAVSYVFNPSKKRELGVVAQEVQEIFPELVTRSKNGYLGVSYDRLGALALEAVKELKADNDNLRALVEKQGLEIEALRAAHP